MGPKRIQKRTNWTTIHEDRRDPFSGAVAQLGATFKIYKPLNRGKKCGIRKNSILLCFSIQILLLAVNCSWLTQWSQSAAHFLLSQAKDKAEGSFCTFLCG